MSIRVFTINDKKMQFSCSAFKTIFDTYKKQNSATKSKTEQDLADKLNDYTLLLENADGGKSMSQLTSDQVHSVKRIYDSIIEFLDVFINTEGFNSYWYPLKEEGYENPEYKIYDIAEGEVHKVSLILDKEYFYLRNTEIYDELSEYVSEDLWDIFNGKLSYAYRFEAAGEGSPTTFEDYDKAMIKINGIIEKYI
jgi:hypothetical protein